MRRFIHDLSMSDISSHDILNEGGKKDLDDEKTELILKGKMLTPLVTKKTNFRV